MKVLQFFIVVFLPLTLFSQETPPIVKFSPNTYQAENQNGAVTQNADNFIFVANNEGLLEYDGAEWTLYPSPNNTIIRSVLALKKGFLLEPTWSLVFGKETTKVFWFILHSPTK